MISPQELLHHAAKLLADGQATGPGPGSETGARRAISATYYALFHTLVADTASRLAPSDPPGLRPRLRRVFEHRQMRSVCDLVLRWNKSQQAEALKPILAPALSNDLLSVAEIFVKLQEVRHAADYDLVTPVSLNDAIQAVQSAYDAHDAWAAIRDTPDAAVFLTLLLLGDRLYRRG